MPIYKVAGQKKDGLQKYRVVVNYTDENGKKRTAERREYGKAQAERTEAALRERIKSGERPKERTQFRRYTVHGRQNALASWVAAILRIWGTLLAPCGSTVARNSILAEVDKSCKREKIKILQSGKSPNRRLPVTGSPPQYHRPPVCALPPPRPKYGIKYVIAKRAGPFSLEKQGKDGPVVS